MSGRCSVIYADPPWQYRNNKGQGVAENHYNTMSMDELKALPVGDLAAKEKGERGMTVGDLIGTIPRAIRECEEE